MGIFDSFRKEEVTGTKVLVGQLGTGQGTKFDEELKADLRVYKRFYPAAVSATFTTVAELRGAAKPSLRRSPSLLRSGHGRRDHRRLRRPHHRH